jgi:glycosyltransferase involved in cell wall biosynthesis
MASGLPIVATAVDGASEIVEPGENGYLVPPGDPAALARALQDLVRQPALRDRLGTNGRERAAEFDLERMIRALEELYREAVHEHQSGRRTKV